MDRCENALHPVAVRDIIEHVGQMRHAPSAKLFECLSSYSFHLVHSPYCSSFFSAVYLPLRVLNPAVNRS